MVPNHTKHHILGIILNSGRGVRLRSKEHISRHWPSGQHSQFKESNSKLNIKKLSKLTVKTKLRGVYN